MKKLFVLLVVVGWCGIVLAAEKSTIAVLPFKVSSGIEVEIKGQGGNNLRLTRSIILREFSNQLNVFLAKSRKFTVMDRENISKVMNENKLTESDWAKPGQEQKVGKLLVADYLVNGTINRLDFQVIRQNIQITGEIKPRIVATFKVQFSVTEVATGKMVFADQVIEKLKSVDVRREIPISERKDWILADYKDLLFEKTATKVGNAILGGIFPVKIASISGDSVVLNRGAGAGIIVGQQYRVYKLGASVIDPDTKEVLGSSEEVAGVIVITATEPRFSKARIVSKKMELQNGWICRPLTQKVKNAAPAYPKATPGW
ncbi:MAG: CsgG/HfaB family protein [Victivallaceae bacterium]|nr:CsgG/HfaB family protein [Victivallaceae bacterium]